MNLMEAVQSVLSQYFGFRGRARRSEYWFLDFGDDFVWYFCCTHRHGIGDLICATRTRFQPSKSPIIYPWLGCVFPSSP